MKTRRPGMFRKRRVDGFLPALVFVTFFSFAAFCAAAEQPPQEGEAFPDLKFPTPQTKEHLAYLGMNSKVGPTFKLGQVKADVVIFEVFSMYCPYCQNEAPSVNGLFTRIFERGLEGKIKLIGLGAGNSPYEVGLFRVKYGIQFPLLPDEELTIHTALGKVRTPYFIAVRLGHDGKGRVIYSRVGTIGDPGQFLDFIIEKAGIP
jgi:peroxiredoxin